MRLNTGILFMFLGRYFVYFYQKELKFFTKYASNLCVREHLSE